MTEVHLLFPQGYADPGRPSGGNRYDEAVAAGLARLGWRVVVHEVPHAWPVPDPAAAASIEGAIERELAAVPDGRVVVVDGLLATVGEGALLRAAGRLRLVALVHQAEPPGAPPPGVLAAARMVLATSAATARVLVERGRPVAGVAVVPPGVQPAVLANGTPTGAALLCVAAVGRAKGHDLLFAALAELADQTWTCTCVGPLDREPAFVAEQRQALVANGIADRVRFTGSLAGADLEHAYAAADLLVLPTRSESYGLVLVEALARGLPVLAADVGGVPEAVGQAPDGRRPGILVAPEDHMALAAALAGWLTDPGLRADLRSAARSRRATLATWDQTAIAIARVLERVGAT